MDIVLYALTALLYGGLAVAGWRSHRHAGSRPMLESVPPMPAAATTGANTQAQSGFAGSAASGMSTYGRALLFVALLAHGMLLLLVERRLHAMRGGIAQRNVAAAGNGWLSSWRDTLPPLLSLEKLLFRLFGAVFVLLTLTLVSGILFSEQ